MNVRFLLVVGALVLSWVCNAGRYASGDDQSPASGASKQQAGLTFSCTSDNDLFKILVASDVSVTCHDLPLEAIERSAPDSGVLILADGYPGETVRISSDALAVARAKKLRLYIEYPESIPGMKFEPPRRVHWERVVVASKSVDLGLPPMRILSLHDCQFRPTSAAAPALVMARVAGFDTAVYGLPKEHFPILFRGADSMLIATTKLSDFNTARYAPSAEWRLIWRHILDDLDPAGTPHDLKFTPRVRSTFDKDEALPKDAESRALARAAKWVRESRLLISAEREPRIHDLLRSGAEEDSAPAATDPVGDGTRGILEGYASRIAPDGSQTQRLPIRADCQAESAAVLAMHAMLTSDASSRQVAENLLNYLYFKSDMHGGVRNDAKHPAFGLIGWGAIAPAWQVANYGDDNARTLLATMVVAASLESDEWDAAMLKALLANLRTTGRLGFRGDRIDNAALEQLGWKHFYDSETVNLSPHFEAYLWACYLWAYARTGEQEFLDRTKIAIRTTMEAYPDRWHWGNHVERSHMLLALAWLVRIEDTAEHREWLTRIAGDILADQAPCGAIVERVRGAGAGHYLVPASNEAYGTSETPLLQQNGDSVSDQLYTTGFVLLALHEAAAATGDPSLAAAEDKLAEYLVRIQVRSETVPYLDGAWFRAFDFNRWDYWASSADMGWGAWCAESGWGPAWNAIVFGLRAKRTSFWELTASSQIARQWDAVNELMSVNDGGPYRRE